MAEWALKYHFPYEGSCFILPTKHGKSRSIGPVMWETLRASVLEYVLDTDQLGTFAGEVERKESALDCARKKCEWSIEFLGNKVEFVLASEGSFGMHPHLPFLPCDHEILYFIDRKHGFHLHVSHWSENTNYRMGAVDSFDGLLTFAEEAQFSSHGLIVRPDNRDTKGPIFKGINSQKSLEKAFTESLGHSAQGKVWVETDMRANFNPSRMRVIGELAQKFAERLRSYCPQCGVPGWGSVRVERGLRCHDCSYPTDLIKQEILGCPKCTYEESKDPLHGFQYAKPINCPNCNP